MDDRATYVSGKQHRNGDVFQGSVEAAGSHSGFEDGAIGARQTQRRVT